MSLSLLCLIEIPLFDFQLLRYLAASVNCRKRRYGVFYVNINSFLPGWYKYDGIHYTGQTE